ncbi:hypothetical protein LshimejAT787_0600680 [Lyophyllum shimeji]|uniref:Uncharacterized protein n=1 Tax=Lyophyllum shimeji TaxID=47721 RepID=A0A9P3UQ56_LYOSH|nr:hypothetical protein LshimejAT787_0600680 [Lyophyllum shimeji]
MDRLRTLDDFVAFMAKLRLRSVTFRDVDFYDIPAPQPPPRLSATSFHASGFGAQFLEKLFRTIDFDCLEVMRITRCQLSGVVVPSGNMKYSRTSMPQKIWQIPWLVGPGYGLKSTASPAWTIKFSMEGLMQAVETLHAMDLERNGRSVDDVFVRGWGPKAP